MSARNGYGKSSIKLYFFYDLLILNVIGCYNGIFLVSILVPFPIQ
jgi:hypothetical protein